MTKVLVESANFELLLWCSYDCVCLSDRWWGDDCARFRQSPPPIYTTGLSLHTHNAWSSSPVACQTPYVAGCSSHHTTQTLMLRTSDNSWSAMSTAPRRRVLVLGAGVVGLSTAVRIQEQMVSDRKKHHPNLFSVSSFKWLVERLVAGVEILGKT